MAGSLQWHGDEFNREIREKLAKRLEAAAAILQATIVKSLAVSWRTHGPSKPGEQPHARTGLLMKSIFYSVEPESLTAIVGTSLKYGMFLELGTHKMRPRPFIRPAVEKCRERLQKLGIKSTEFGVGETVHVDDGPIVDFGDGPAGSM